MDQDKNVILAGIFERFPCSFRQPREADLNPDYQIEKGNLSVGGNGVILLTNIVRHPDCGNHSV